MLINIDPQPNIKPPERLTYTLKNATVFVDFTKKSDLTPSIKILEMEINMN